MTKITERESCALKQLKKYKRKQKIKEWLGSILLVLIFFFPVFLLIIMLGCTPKPAQQKQNCAPVYNIEGNKAGKVLCSYGNEMLYELN